MENTKKRKKFGFIKFFVLILIFCGMMIYSASFPVTMELLDERVTGVLALIGAEKDFSGFKKFSDFSRKTINKAELFIEIIRENIEGESSEPKKVPTFLITCAGSFPAEGHNITSAFGNRKDPFSEKEDFHSGIDISASKGSGIFAAWPGKVFKTGYDGVYGKYVIIKHSEKFFTKYCHLSKIHAKENDFINSGEIIGEAGSTGRSTGSHLHFEVIVDGRKIDPAECLKI